MARNFRRFIEGENQRARLSLSTVLTEISNLRAQRWVRLNIEAALIIHTVADVLASKRQMELVILYLVKSAERALLQSEGKRELRMLLSAEGKNVRVEIYNSSPVDIPVMQTRLSKSPFSASSEGAAGGLDLAIASSIVEHHDGRIRVERQPGGNSVILELSAYSDD